MSLCVNKLGLALYEQYSFIYIVFFLSSIYLGCINQVHIHHTKRHLYASSARACSWDRDEEDGSRQSGVADVSSRPSDLLGCAAGSSCYSDSLVNDVRQRRASARFR